METTWAVRRKSFQQFDALVKDLLKVPKSTIHERHAAHKKRRRRDKARSQVESRYAARRARA